MRERDRFRRLWALAAVALLTVCVQGCESANRPRNGQTPVTSPMEGVRVTPDLVSLITARAVAPLHRSAWEVTLANGQTVLLKEILDDDRPGYLYLDSQAAPSVGDLFIAGSRPSPWFTIANHAPIYEGNGRVRDCYHYGIGGKENVDSFDFDVGRGNSVRLLKAPDFDPFGSYGPGHALPPAACLDSRARVKRVAT